MDAVYRGGDNQNAISVDTKKLVYYDFVLGVGGTLKSLLAKHNECLDGIDQVEFSQPPEPLFDEQFFQWQDYNSYDTDYSYFISRGIDEKVLKFFNNKIGNGKMKNRSCFPIVDEHGRLNGVSGRILPEFQKDNSIKWKHLLSSSFYQYPCWLRNKNNVPVGARAIEKEKSCVVVESIGDCLALYNAGVYNTMCSFGLKIHSRVICTMIRLGSERVYIALNNDNNNRGNDAAIKQRKRLTELWNESNIRILKPPNSKNDFGDCDKEEIIEWKKKIKY